MRLRDARLLLVAVIVPILLAALSMWSIGGNSTGSDITRLKAAIVNLDKGAEMTLPDGSTQFVPFGRQLSAELLKPHDGTATFQWELMQVNSAHDAIKNGDVAAIVTIPENFSTAVATIGQTDANPGIVSLTSSDATAPMMNELAHAVTEAAARSLGQTLGTQVLNGVYLGFDQLKDQLGAAANGARQLDSGIGSLGQGAHQLADGVHQSTDGTYELAGGLAQLADGTAALESGVAGFSGGIGQLHAGAEQLSGGIHQMRDGIAGSASSPGLTGGVDQLADGILGNGTTPGLASGSLQLAEGTEHLADGIARLDSGLDTIRALIPEDFDPADLPTITIDLQQIVDVMKQVARDARDVLSRLEPIMTDQDVINELRSSLLGLIDRCPAETFPQYCADMKEFGQLIVPFIDGLPTVATDSLAALDDFLAKISSDEFADGLADAQHFVDHYNEYIAQIVGPDGLLAGVSQLATGSQQLASAARQMADGINGTDSTIGLVQGVTQLQNGVHQLQDGFDGTEGQPGLVSGADRLADGLAQLSAGVGRFSGGISQLNEGAQGAADGSSQLADGLGQLGNGADQLSTGIDQLRDGSSQLADGLDEGVSQIPVYSDAERTRIVSMAMRPVQTEQDATTQSTIGTAFPFTAAVLIWISAFGAFLMMPGLRGRVLARPVGAVRAVIDSLRAPSGVVAISVLGVICVALLFKVSPVSLAGTGALIIVGAIVAVLVHQMLLAVCGARIGRVVSLLFFTLQVVALIGLMPYQDSPDALSTMNALLPLGELAGGLQTSVLGVGSSWVPPLLSLIGWGLVSFIGSAVAVTQRRTLSPEKVREALNVVPM